MAITGNGYACTYQVAFALHIALPEHEEVLAHRLHAVAGLSTK